MTAFLPVKRPILKFTAMKTNAVQSIFLLVLLSALAACKGDSSDCEKPVSLVQPASNPAGYEVIVRAPGFTPDAEVRFGQEVAQSRAGEGSDIIARVPAGLLGNVEISLEEDGCIGRRAFSVLPALPAVYGLSLPNIVLPTVPTNFPSGISNFYVNAADSDHFINLQPDPDDPAKIGGDANEFHNTNPALGANGNFNPITGTWDAGTNTIYVEIDRTGNGGAVEKFDGEFINGFPGAPANMKRFVLLVSRTTGRQMVLMSEFE
jgi:hypothetical protein